MGMSEKLKSSREAKAVDRPFAPEIERRAGELVPLYQVIVRWDPENECFAGRCIELPNAVGFAETEAECAAEVRGNADALVCVMFELLARFLRCRKSRRGTNQINGVRFCGLRESRGGSTGGGGRLVAVGAQKCAGRRYARCELDIKMRRSGEGLARLQRLSLADLSDFYS